jgi:5-(carboxyamino)imidazole ribonucleotide synthase
LTLFKDKLIVNEPITIGIVGGGQLGKMIAAEAKRMAMRVIVLDPLQDCPASSIADKVIVGNFSDEQKIYELANEVDTLTYEIELANSRALSNLVKQGFPVNPTPNTLFIIQNKYRQKKFLKENGIKVPDFELIENEYQLKNLCFRYGFPIMLKACEESYDGRGNYLITNEKEISKAYSFFGKRECMIEEHIDFKKEVSIMIARNTLGDISYFPVVENIHINNILDTTIAPADISDDLRIKVIDMATKTIECLHGSGIFGIEMFIDKSNKVLINEIAPRPHNSGHYSIEACSISQFEQHIRAILNYPMPKPILISSAVMVNILGPPNVNGPYEIKGIDNLFALEGTKLHVYGKKTSKFHRKLGHVTAITEGKDPLKISQEIKNVISIQESENDQKK